MASSCIPCPKGFGPCALPRASLGCGTLIIADKWKKKLCQHQMELFVSLLLHRNDNRRLRVPLNFIILQLIFWNSTPQQRATLHLRAPVCTRMLHVRLHTWVCMSVCVCVTASVCVCVHGFTVFECVQMLLLTVKRQDQAAAPGTALVKTCILNKFCQITLAHT